jgi:hypothetical protein
VPAGLVAANALADADWAAGNWVAVGATLAALGGVGGATFVLPHRKTAPTPSIGPSAGVDRDGNLRRTHELGKVRTGYSRRGARMARVLASGRHMRGPRGGLAMSRLASSRWVYGPRPACP